MKVYDYRDTGYSKKQSWWWLLPHRIHVCYMTLTCFYHTNTNRSCRDIYRSSHGSWCYWVGACIFLVKLYYDLTWTERFPPKQVGKGFGKISGFFKGNFRVGGNILIWLNFWTDHRIPFCFKRWLIKCSWCNDMIHCEITLEFIIDLGWFGTCTAWSLTKVRYTYIYI